MRLRAREESWPLARPFVIARGAKFEARVVVAELEHDGRRGRGECVPYARYGETVEGVLARIEEARPAIEGGAGREALQALMTPGAARNALDCALWDLEAKTAGRPAWALANLPQPAPLKTAYTISWGPPEAMAEAARANARRPLLKLKIGGPADIDAVAAVRAAAPSTRLVVDANESLTFADLRRLASEFARLKVRLLEQPLKAGEDEALEGYDSPLPLCADESLHTRAELPACARRYAAVNIKLDKTGGLTEALALRAAARARGLQVMVGSMVATSLAVAPAMLLGQGADLIDLDGPLLLARDREPSLALAGSILQPPPPELWG
ncbi:MAG TPA: N-acetyl-D-Glu racemase DgcA [Caulobacteraceae bacterium]|jgi:L-alanine-DL-glutamate epimerase-like enolase superfamily enzyme